MEKNCEIADVRRLRSTNILKDCKTSDSILAYWLIPVSSAWAGGRAPPLLPGGASREGGRAGGSPPAPRSHLSPRPVCGVSILELSAAPRSTSAAPHTLLLLLLLFLLLIFPLLILYPSSLLVFTSLS